MSTAYYDRCSTRGIAPKNARFLAAFEYPQSLLKDSTLNLSFTNPRDSLDLHASGCCRVLLRAWECTACNAPPPLSNPYPALYLRVLKP
jgi:hypothetical protein